MAFYMKSPPFNNGKENRKANKLRRTERKARAKEIKDSGVSADKYSFTGHESDMGKYDKKGRHKEFPEQRYSKKNPASNKPASDMMRTNYLSPFLNGKKNLDLVEHLILQMSKKEEKKLQINYLMKVKLQKQIIKLIEK